MFAGDPVEKTVEIDNDWQDENGNTFVVYHPRASNNLPQGYEDFMPRGILINGRIGEDPNADATWAKVRLMTFNDNTYRDYRLATHIWHPMRVKKIDLAGSDASSIIIGG